MMIQTALAAGSAQSPESIAGIVLGDLALILLAAAVFAALAKRVRQPAVMGEIVAGIALGPSVLGLLPGDLTGLLFPPSARPYLQVLAQVGLVLFMFGVGYGFSPSHLSGAGGRVMLVSLSSVALPFALGAGLAVLLNPWFDRSEMRVDDLLAPTLFLGAAMSITAFPVLARIITERGMQRDRLGSMALASAAFQDFLAWCVLAGVVAIVSAGGSWSLARTLLGGAAFILVLLWGCAPAWPGCCPRRAPGRAATRSPPPCSAADCSPRHGPRTRSACTRSSARSCSAPSCRASTSRRTRRPSPSGSSRPACCCSRCSSP